MKSKFRVTYRTRSEYCNTGEHLTKVFSVMECDVIASDSIEALKGAKKAFGLSENDGSWAVRTTLIPADTQTLHTEFSTLYNLTDKLF